MSRRTRALPAGHIETRIFFIRGQRVMLSTHLAEMYAVEPRALVQAVVRNRARFPRDFMCQLNGEEFADLKSQFVTSSWGGLRCAAPYAFTEQGVAMLTSVLRSERAIHANIETMRASGRWEHAAGLGFNVAANLKELGIPRPHPTPACSRRATGS